MKLKLVPKVIKPFTPSVKTGWESPVGWWNVTTEGDVEGRSTDTIGEFYGHIAEIAFGMERNGCYSYRFEPILNKEPLKTYDSYPINRKSANISFDVDTWGKVKSEQFLRDIQKWFDTEDVTVHLCNYYSAFTIRLKTVPAPVQDPIIDAIHAAVIKYHDTTCKMAHEDVCGWHYEVTNGVHNWKGDSHQRVLADYLKISGLLVK